MNKVLTPYYVVNMKIILYKFIQNDEVIKIIMSYLLGNLIVKFKRNNISRSIIIENINEDIYNDIRTKVEYIVGINLLEKNKSYKYSINEIYSIGRFINNMTFEDKVEYSDLELSDVVEDSYNIKYIEGCTHKSVIGFDILMILLNKLYFVEYKKATKLVREKAKKTNGFIGEIII